MITRKIIDYAKSQPIFGLRDIYEHFDGDADINRHTVSWYLTKLTASGVLNRVGHGKYAKQNKREFKIKPTDSQCIIIKKTKQKFPLARFCIYDGNVINPLLQHLAANNITYIETEREAVSSVFNFLRDNGYKAFLRPTRELIYNYIDLSQPAIFVKPLTTESPVTECNGILVPTLEKLLVDLQKDKDFFYLQDSEGVNIIRNAFELYAVNESRLLRYAGRRGIREEVLTVINSIKSND